MEQVDGFAFGEGRPRLRRGLRVTHLGDERLVLDPASRVVHTVRGAAVGVLDCILMGRHVAEGEVVTALVASGIVEVPGVTRRRALALSSSAIALVVSSSLPSALAAASTASFTANEGSGSVIEYTLSSPAGAMLYRLVNIQSDTADTSYRLTLGSSTSIDVLLVAGGGAGGGPGDTESAEFFGGGGGGGEVAYISLGTLSGGTQLDFTVAGTSGGIGRDTVLTVGSDSLTAKGGGRGAARIGETLTAATSGGSGGGGTARSTARGTGASGDVPEVGLDATRTAFSDGGLGTVGHRAGAGGGGADTSGVDSTSTTGGDGGDGVTLGGIGEAGGYTGWDLTVASGTSPTAVQNIFGSGGGGAGISSGGSSDAGAQSSRGGLRLDLTAFGQGIIAGSGNAGPIGSGAGGGGGIRFLEEGSYLNAGPGDGGSGVVWVRTS